MTECAHWWFKPNNDGRCEEQRWRKSTAIAVPVVVVAAIAAGIVFVIVRCRTKHAAKAHATPEAPMRDKVVENHDEGQAEAQ